MSSTAGRTITLNIVGNSSSAQKAVNDVASQSESASSRIAGAFKSSLGALSGIAGGAFAPITEVIDQLDGKFDGLKLKVGDIGKVMLAGGAGIAGAGAALTALGSGEQQAQQQLSQAIANTGGSFDDYKDRIESTVKSMEKYGDTSVQTQGALQTLTQATNSPTKALGLMGEAADLAAARHESLGEASQQLAQIVAGKGTRTLALFGISAQQAAGQMKLLQTAQTDAGKADAALAKAKQNLIDLETIDHGKKSLTIADHIALRNATDAVTTASVNDAAAHAKLTAAQTAAAGAAKNHTSALDLLQDKLKGQAAAASDTFTGKLDHIKAAVEDNVASLGQKYGPALTATGAGLSVLGAGVEGAGAIFSKFRTVQEASTVATEAMTVATDEAAVAEGLALGPILLIIAAVALIGVAIYELVTHWSTVWATIKAVVADAWHFIDSTFIQPIQHAFADVINFITQHWQLILAILTGPIGAAIIYITTHFDQIVSFFAAIPGRIMSALGSLVNIGGKIIGDILHGLGDVGGTIAGAFTGLAGKVINGIGDLGSIGRDIIDSVIGGIDDAINVVNSHIPQVLGHQIFPSLPTIPKLAAGTSYFQGGIALVGENGPELVSMPQGAQVHPNGSAATQSALGGGNAPIINISAPTASPVEIGHEITWALGRRV